MTSEIRLAVRGDDLGMAHAVNEGMALAWRHGILSQTTVMAPCPWFAEGARLALDLGIPTAVHTTLTAEWENLRWGPLAGPTTCAQRDGTFHRSIEDVLDHVRPEDAVAEIDAQVGRIRDTGIEPGGLDPHMGAIATGSVGSIAKRHGLPFVHGRAGLGMYDSVTMLTHRQDKMTWLQTWLAGLGPGTHLLVTHPGVDGPELAALTDPAAPNHLWAHPGRVTDLAALLDPEVLDVVDRRGITLVAAFGDGRAIPTDKA